MRCQQNYEAMMRRLAAAMAQDEYYLICIAFASLQTKWATDPERCEAAYGTMGKELFERLLEE